MNEIKVDPITLLESDDEDDEAAEEAWAEGSGAAGLVELS